MYSAIGGIFAERSFKVAVVVDVDKAGAAAADDDVVAVVDADVNYFAAVNGYVASALIVKNGFAQLRTGVETF